VPLQKQIIAIDCPCSGFGLKPRRDNARLDLKIKIENYVKPILLVFSLYCGEPRGYRFRGVCHLLRGDFIAFLFLVEHMIKHDKAMLKHKARSRYVGYSASALIWRANPNKFPGTLIAEVAGIYRA